jgi:hypothetical protein
MAKYNTKKNFKKLKANTPLLLLLLAIPITIVAIASRFNLKQNAAAANIEYYVSTTGNDTNSGSQAAPFATIQKAANVATAGATIHVLPGTYTTPVTISVSGTAASPITFISDVKWGAKLVTAGGLKVEPFHNNGSYIHIIGFDITSSTSWTGILTYGQYNLIKDNHVHDLKAMACNGSPGGQGIGDDASASNNTFTGNVVNNIGNYPTKCDYVHGIYVDGPGDIVQNNITYNNAGNGLYYNHGNGNAIFANNLTFANAEYGIGINGNSGADNFIVTNNIVVGNGMAGMKTWSNVSGTHNQFLNNIFYNNPTLYIQSGQGTLQNTITADPKFISYQSNGTGDYHLQSTSPAIDAGTPLGAPTTDFDGVARPQGNTIDIGPYEFLSASPTPTDIVATPTQGNEPSITPTDIPTLTPTNTPTPTSTLTPTPASNIVGEDTFVRPNQSFWGKASDGHIWSGDAASNSVFSISSNTGKVAGNGNSYTGLLGTSVGNVEVFFKGQMNSFSNGNIGSVLHYQDINHWYKAYIDGKALIIQKRNGSTYTTLASKSFSASTNKLYSVRFRIIGNTLSAKVWASSSTEPTSWTITANDSSYTSGYCGVRMLVNGGKTANYTAFSAKSL